MEVTEMAKGILEECLDPTGFLVQLHSMAKFDEPRYRRWLHLISSYAEGIGSDSTIDRSVAGCLYELVAALETALDRFAEVRHPDLMKVQDAHAEIDEVLRNKVFRLTSE